MTVFKLPDLGEGLPDAEIHQWYVKEGDEVKLDQPLVAMETAKAVVDVPSPYTGRIVTLHGKVGDIIPTGQPLVTYAIAGEAEPSSAAQASKVETQIDSGTVVGVIETSDVILQESATGIQVSTQSRSTIKATPAIRALANKLKVDLANISGTGPGGTISAEDVHRAAEAVPTEGEPLRGVRRIMALQMAKSHAEVVPVTLMDDADIHHWPQKIDITARLIQAIIAACQAEPGLNAHFYTSSLSCKHYAQINVGIAVDTPAGLYVPVLKDVANQSAETLRAQLNTLKEKAKAQAFTPEDLKDATITLSNFGTIAGRYANPIIVPPTVAIIGIGKTRAQPVAHDEKVAVHKIMPICLTFDHRAATGGEAARFLAALLANLEG